MAKTIADRLKASRSHMAKVNGENFEDVKNNIINIQIIDTALVIKE